MLKFIYFFEEKGSFIYLFWKTILNTPFCLRSRPVSPDVVRLSVCRNIGKKGLMTWWLDDMMTCWLEASQTIDHIVWILGPPPPINDEKRFYQFMKALNKQYSCNLAPISTTILSHHRNNDNTTLKTTRILQKNPYMF